MDQWLTFLGSPHQAGAVPAGPEGLALAGIGLLLMLGIYAGLVLNADRLPRWLRLPAPASLRSRITGTLVLLAILPTLSMALVLGERTTILAGAATIVAVLVATLGVSLCLALALVRSVCGPLGALDAAVRRFDPELRREVPRAPPGAPQEIAVVFEYLATASERQRASNAELQRSLRRGEQLRRELLAVLDTRETEIESRTELLMEANAQLDRLSRTDTLTGLANRRGLADFLDRAWRAAQRDGQPVSVLMVDVDHFDAYNDRYGPGQADTCLQAVAHAMNHLVCRATDIVARYGGEEFIVVLGNTPLEGALMVGEQIRAAIESLAIPHRGAPEPAVITVSVGVSSSLPGPEAGLDIGLEAADRALHAAKEQGRNRVGYSSVASTGLFQSLCLPSNPDGRPS